MFVYRSSGRHRHQPSQPARGDVALIFIRADATRAERFYGRVLGWQLKRAYPTSNYFDAVDRAGVLDEAAAFGRPIEPSARLYLGAGTAPLRSALDRVDELGGQAGDVAQDLGDYYSALCRDDQGTEFGLMSPTLE